MTISENGKTALYNSHCYIAKPGSPHSTVITGRDMGLTVFANPNPRCPYTTANGQGIGLYTVLAASFNK